MNRRAAFAATAAAIALLAAAACRSDATTPPEVRTGSVAGVVSGPAGQLAGVSVRLDSGAVARTAATGADGVYRFDSLAVGGHTVTLLVPQGYYLSGSLPARSLRVDGDTTATASFILQRGTGDTVVVHATAALKFAPSDITVRSGSTVRWIDDAAVTHTVTPDSATLAESWRPDTLTTAGQTAQHTFTAAVEHVYHCAIHRGSGMTGVVRVQAP